MVKTFQILIVEDEPNVRLVFRTALESDGFAVSVAENGEVALDLLKSEPADLILLDLRMPGLGGLELLSTLREMGIETPVVIVSAYDRAANVVQAMRLGAIDFLPKPLTPGALRGVVAEVLARNDRQGRLADGSRPRDMLSVAKRALGHRLFHRAGVLLKEAIKETPDSPEPRYLMGVLHEVQDHPRGAEKWYQEALRIDPDFEPARLHLIKYQHDHGTVG